MSVLSTHIKNKAVFQQWISETVLTPLKPYSNDDFRLEIPDIKAARASSCRKIAARICAASVRATPSLRRHKFAMLTLLRFSKIFSENLSHIIDKSTKVNPQNIRKRLTFDVV